MESSLRGVGLARRVTDTNARRDAIVPERRAPTG
jgi:hypothetical protein